MDKILDYIFEQHPKGSFVVVSLVIGIYLGMYHARLDNRMVNLDEKLVQVVEDQEQDDKIFREISNTMNKMDVKLNVLDTTFKNIIHFERKQHEQDRKNQKTSAH